MITLATGPKNKKRVLVQRALDRYGKTGPAFFMMWVHGMNYREIGTITQTDPTQVRLGAQRAGRRVWETMEG